MSIYLTGASGFVGKSFIADFNKDFNIKKHVRGTDFVISQKIVVHLAGKAHDLKNISNGNEYYEVNTELTKKIFDSFLNSDSSVFIMLSSVKAIADEVKGILTEDTVPNPKSHYGKSKLLAEEYVFSKQHKKEKRIYILRPCMIHGPENKGNLNLLYKTVSNRIPWFLGSYKNQRSYCSIKNLLFIIRELIDNKGIPSGIYNIADDKPLSTNEVITLISNSQKKKPIILSVSKKIISIIAYFGDIVPLPLNSERLKKLTESYVVSNKKIKKVIGKPLLVSSKNGMLETFNAFLLNKKN